MYEGESGAPVGYFSVTEALSSQTKVKHSPQVVVSEAFGGIQQVRAWLHDDS